MERGQMLVTFLIATAVLEIAEVRGSNITNLPSPVQSHRICQPTVPRAKKKKTSVSTGNVADEEVYHYVPPIVACFVNSSAFKREGSARYSYEGLPVDMCTHIVYSYFTADPNTGKLSSNSSSYSDNEGAAKELYCLKRQFPKLKLMLSFDDGKANKANVKFLSDNTTRKAFVKSVVRQLLKYGFDGLNIHWGPQQYCSSLEPTLAELKAAFASYDFLLTITLPACTLDCSFFKKKLATLVDYVFLSTFHYRPIHVGKVDVPNLELPRYFDPANQQNSEDCLAKWIGSVPRYQLVFGLSFMGTSYTLADQNQTDLLSKVNSANPKGNAGEFTKTPGELGYFEVCSYIKNKNYTRVWSRSSYTYFAYHKDQWVGYEDIWSLGQKTEYVKGNRLGGVFLWSLDMDDYRGECDVQYPLLRAVDKALGDYDVSTFVFKEGCYKYKISELTPESCSGSSASPQGDPRDCAAYYVCKSGKKRRRRCYPGNVWNTKTQKCVSPNEADRQNCM